MEIVGKIISLIFTDEFYSYCGQNPDLDLRNFLKNFLSHLIYEMSY